MLALYGAVKGDDYEGEIRNLKKVVGAMELGALESSLNEDNSRDTNLCQEIFACTDNRDFRVILVTF